MSPRYPLVPIGDIAVPANRPEEPVLGLQYRQVGVRLWGQGAYEREPIDGGDTKYKTLNRVQAGDIIVNKIWARNGSVSVVSESLDGCYCSGEFPTFSPKHYRLLPEWFYWITKAPWFWDACDEKSRGTSGKNRIRPERFLEISIPLPTIPEQKRITAVIASISQRLNRARGLRHDVDNRITALRNSILRSAFDSPWKSVRLESVCVDIIDNLHSNPIYADIGIPCLRSSDVGWGSIDLSRAKKTSEGEYIRRTRRGEPRPGDIVFVREGGGTGKAGITLPRQRFSLGQRVMMLRPDPTQVNALFLLYQILSPQVQEDQIAPFCKGSAAPHLNIGALKQFRIKVPDLTIQAVAVARLSTLLAKCEELVEREQQLHEEADKIVPSILDRAFNGGL